MRKLLKVVTTVSVALLLTAGVAFGQNNEATVEQHAGTSGDLEAQVDQSGSQHDAEIRQGVVTTQNRVGAKKSDATITQSGSGAEATILQGRRGGFSAKSTAKINQVGDSKALIWQGVGTKSSAEQNNLATQSQKGSGHFGEIGQGVRTGGGQSTKTTGNEAAQYQRNGSNNYAGIVQGFRSGSYAQDSKARQLQNGSDLRAEIRQGTDGNWATGMEAIQKQYGNGHTATTIQSGVNSFAKITQSN
jgi:hypothetical protein